MKCVKDIESKQFNCLKRCEGLQVTSFDALKPAPEFQNTTQELLEDYKKFNGIKAFNSKQLKYRNLYYVYIPYRF